MQQRPLPARLPADERNVLFQLFRTNQALRALMAEVVAGTGVSAEEYALLGVIHFFPERTPTELAATIGMPPTSVSRHVARFVEDRLVERLPNPADGRSYLLKTTAEGGAAVETIAPRISTAVDRLEALSELPLEDIGKALRALEAAASAVASAGLASTR